MTVEIFTFCFAATPGHHGELNILGATDRIAAAQFPMGLQWSTVVAKIRFERIEEGEKEIKFSFVNSDGKPILNPPPPQKINVQIPPGVSTSSFLVVFGMQNLWIPSAGEYQIGLAVNGRHEMSVPLIVQAFGQRPPVPS